MSLLHRLTMPPAIVPAPTPAPAARAAVPPPVVATTGAVAALAVDRPVSLMERLFGVVPKLTDDEVDEGAERRQGELTRVLGMPIAKVPERDWTAELRLPHGTMALRPIQSLALSAAQEHRGLLGLIGVGHGKTLLSALLPVVMGSELAVLLVPAPLVKKTEYEFQQLRRHWKIPPPERLHVISYSKLSTQSDLLERLLPDLIIADEAHLLKDAKSARTKRFLRYFKLFAATRGVRFCGLSGTMTNRSLMDYWHLAKLALGERSPVPLNYAEVGLWDVVFGSMEEDRRRAAAASGARIALPGPEAERVERRFLKWAGRNRDKLDLDPDLELTGRVAFAKRLRTSPGVVATSEGGCDASLVITMVKDIPIPAEVTKALQVLEETWCIGEEELDDPMRVADCRRRLVAGYWNRWVWPAEGRDEEWLTARSDWARAVRGFLKRAGSGYDSPGLVAAAAARKDVRVKSLWEVWDVWAAVKHRPQPPTEVVWIDRYLVDWAIAEGNKAPSVVFYSGRGMEQGLREAGCKVFAAGAAASAELVTLAQRVLDGHEPARTIYCSIQSHGTGKNLHGWSRMVVAVPPTDGQTWEQMLGREHRNGQQADTVEVIVAAHAEPFVDALQAALRDARYIQESTEQAQRLLFADIVG